MFKLYVKREREVSHYTQINIILYYKCNEVNDTGDVKISFSNTTLRYARNKRHNKNRYNSDIYCVLFEGIFFVDIKNFFYTNMMFECIESLHFFCDEIIVGFHITLIIF